MTTNNMIDLNTCVPGQKLELRNGNIVEYVRKLESACMYPHEINGEEYTDDGRYLTDREDSWDVVKILPMEKPKPEIDLNTCVPGQKVRLRCGRINCYTGLIKDGYGGKYRHEISGDSYMDNGCYWSDYRESELDVVEILPVEEEPVKTEPELTHSITDQIDVTSPDHVSIISHEHGVTISIKKGNTTINWRHSNS